VTAAVAGEEAAEAMDLVVARALEVKEAGATVHQMPATRLRG